jgi:hypothetical protein
MRKISPVHGISALTLALAVNSAWAYPTVPSSSSSSFAVHKGCSTYYANCHAFIFQETTAAGHQLAAQAIFQIGSDGDLYVTLSNMSSETGTYNPEDFLTGLFFNLRDTSGNLITLGTSAAVQALARPTNIVASASYDAVPGFNSNIVNASASALSPGMALSSRLGTDYNVGGEWQYQSSPGGAYSGFGAGLSSTTLGGLFTNANMNGLNLDPLSGNACTDTAGATGAAALNLDNCGTVAPSFPHQMGLVGSNFSDTTPASGDRPLAIQDSVRFKFDLTAAQAAALDLSKKGVLDIGFQYGSTAGSGFYTVPEPGMLGLLALGGLALASRRRRLWLQGRSKSPDPAARNRSPGIT